MRDKLISEAVLVYQALGFPAYATHYAVCMECGKCSSGELILAYYRDADWRVWNKMVVMGGDWIENVQDEDLLSVILGVLEEQWKNS